MIFIKRIQEFTYALQENFGKDRITQDNHKYVRMIFFNTGSLLSINICLSNITPKNGRVFSQANLHLLPTFI